MTKVMIIAIYYQEEHKSKIDALVNPLAPAINGIEGCEGTVPYRGDDYENLFLHIHETQKEFLESIKLKLRGRK